MNSRMWRFGEAGLRRHGLCAEGRVGLRATGQSKDGCRSAALIHPCYIFLPGVMGGLVGPIAATVSLAQEARGQMPSQLGCPLARNRTESISPSK